jgi:uncharacterized membrane protein
MNRSLFLFLIIVSALVLFTESYLSFTTYALVYEQVHALTTETFLPLISAAFSLGAGIATLGLGAIYVDSSQKRTDPIETDP